MNKVLKYFKEHDNLNIFSNEITVYGWQDEYRHILTSSISKYLFEDLDITENIVEVNEKNRPGRVTEKKYVTVHDTGDSSILHTAKFWSEAVKNQKWEMKEGETVPYLCSYQYVVDNEGIYHNVPDNEVAYHAGDTTKYDYALYKTNVTGTNIKPIITISTDGYYEIDGKITICKAPRIYHEKEGIVLIDRNPETNDINDQGILCELIDGEYYIGETYYNTGYKKIANRGGNNNSIGIESCINRDSDIYYTWQKTAKLVAKLLIENNLEIKDVRQHHYFSGKNCPQTMRMNNKWQHLLELIEFEKQIILFKREGYIIELISNDECLNNQGRVNIGKYSGTIKYKIRTTKDDKVEELELEKSINI